MIVKFETFINEDAEVTPNNTSGTAGDTSSTRDQAGFLTTGNDGNFGIQFTPRGEKSIGTYKARKPKQKVFRKNKKYKDEKHYNV